MPDWVIKINKAADGSVQFDPSPIQALVGDIITWANYDDTAHWPAPMDSNGKIDPEGFMPTQIAPGGSSIGYVVSLAVGTTTYCCALHPDEKGSIEVLSAPPTIPNA